MPPRKVTMGSSPIPQDEILVVKKMEAPAIADMKAAVVPEPVITQEEIYEKDDGEVTEAEDYDSYRLEDLDPSTPLWIGGPTVQMVLDWKAEHGDVYITNVTYDKHVVWRTLKRAEYKYLVRTVEQVIAGGKMSQSEAGMLNEEMTCEICSLYPKFTVADFENDMAGLPAILSQQILESSGFTTIEVRLL